MVIKARLICESILKTEYAEIVKLRAVYSDDKKSPNYSFSQATPSAEMTMTVSNQAAWGAFVPGAQYDLTFEPTVKPAA
jgi:hypothetical protein